MIVISGGLYTHEDIGEDCSVIVGDHPGESENMLVGQKLVL